MQKWSLRNNTLLIIYEFWSFYYANLQVFVCFDSHSNNGQVIITYGVSESNRVTVVFLHYWKYCCFFLQQIHPHLLWISRWFPFNMVECLEVGWYIDIWIWRVWLIITLQKLTSVLNLWLFDYLMFLVIVSK